MLFDAFFFLLLEHDTEGKFLVLRAIAAAFGDRFGIVGFVVENGLVRIANIEFRFQFLVQRRRLVIDSTDRPIEYEEYEVVVLLLVYGSSIGGEECKLCHRER